MIEALRGIDRLTWFNRISGGYLLLMVPLYWNYEAYDSTLWEKFLVAHIVVIRMGIGWLLSALSNRENGGRFALDTPILLYLGLVALSWMWAINPLKSGMEVIRVLLAATDGGGSLRMAMDGHGHGISMPWHGHVHGHAMGWP